MKMIKKNPFMGIEPTDQTTYSRGTQIAYRAKTQKNCTREIYGWIFVYGKPEYRLTWNHCIAMRHELHYVENTHFVWEAVKLFGNSICVVHSAILKMWRLMQPTFKLKQRFYYLQNSHEFKCKGSRFIHHKFSTKKKTTTQNKCCSYCLRVWMLANSMI